MLRHKNNSGIILITVIVVMSVLTVFALSAGALVSTSTHFLEKKISKTRALATALAGVHYTIALMNTYPSRVDTWWQSGVHVASLSQAKQYFHQVVLSEEARFDVEIIDQTRRLNLNALNASNQLLLAHLIRQYGFAWDEGQQVAQNVVDWTTQLKKAPFDDVAELMMVKGMTKNIFDKIYNDVTIYPKVPLNGLQVNYWTASPELYQALVQHVIQERHVQDPQTIVSIAQRYRVKEGPLNPLAMELAMMIPAMHVPVAMNYQIHVKGVDALSQTEVVINAFIQKDQNGMWQIERLNRS